MEMDSIWVALFSLMASLILGVAPIAFLESELGLLGRLNKLIGSKKGKAVVPIQPETAGERIARLSESLSKYSREVDVALAEIEQAGRRRVEAVAELERKLAILAEKEREKKDQVAALEKVPIELLSRFEEIIAIGDLRSARRDYKLFALGVIVTTAITIMLAFMRV